MHAWWLCCGCHVSTETLFRAYQLALPGRAGKGWVGLKSCPAEQQLPCQLSGAGSASILSILSSLALVVLGPRSSRGCGAAAGTLR
jgi:hypothetical protein